jgi:hypothetical protein
MSALIVCVIVLLQILRVSAQQWEWVMPFTVDVPGNVVTVCVFQTLALRPCHTHGTIHITACIPLSLELGAFGRGYGPHGQV